MSRQLFPIRSKCLPNIWTNKIMFTDLLFTVKQLNKMLYIFYYSIDCVANNRNVTIFIMSH